MLNTNVAPAAVNEKLLEQYGKFERKNVQTRCMDKPSTLAVFLVASILEAKNKKLLKEAKGLDDVIRVPFSLALKPMKDALHFLCILSHLFRFSFRFWVT